MKTGAPYIGRFAPSPTGPLHFGSLVAAMGSYLQARKSNGHWLLRIEDLDPPREKPGTSDHIIRTLEQFGFEWHGSVIYQSNNTQHYLQALNDLQQQGLLYSCDCTRKQIIANARQTSSAYIYSGSCRDKPASELGPERATRIKVQEPCHFSIIDLIQGGHSQNVAKEVGDFMLRRRDGLWSYQLAVVIDDFAENVTEIVRGKDLLNNTARQIYLQKLLNLPTPQYAHLPLAVNDSGDKLSKQTFAEALDPKNKFTALYAAWHFLGQLPISSSEQAQSLDEFWSNAVSEWDISRIPM